MMTIALIAVCSNKQRPSVHSNRKQGASTWSRDVYHIANSGITTLCGRDRSEWLTIGPIQEITGDCCSRCAAIAEATGAA